LMIKTGSRMTPSIIGPSAESGDDERSNMNANI
jgi:hypothetical protein